MLDGGKIIWKAEAKVGRKENNMEGGGEGWTEGEYMEGEGESWTEGG